MNNINHINKCPVCGGEKFVSKYNCNDWLVSKETFAIERCVSCRFLFTQNAPDASSIGNYYQSENYISHSNTRKTVIDKLYHFVRKIMLKRKAKIVLKHAPKKAHTLLDIGCGTGHFLNHFKYYGWNIYGVDESETARAFAAENFGLSIDPPKKLFEFEQAQFDAITLWHSLEHLHSLNETMSQLYKLLRKNGVLVVAVPNPASADAYYYKASWAAFDVPRHLWHFTPTTLGVLANKHGFYIKKMYPMPADAFYISILTEKQKKPSWAFVRGFIRGKLCWLTSLGNRKKSSSIIYILQKRF